MAIHIIPTPYWVLTCRKCESALAYSKLDIRSSLSTGDYIICPNCNALPPVPDLGQRIPYQMKTFW